MTSRGALLCLGLLALTATARAQTMVTEPPDLSGSVGSPTPITLGAGLNTVSGTVATPGDRQDNFTVTVPAGTTLTSVELVLDTTRGFVGSVTWNLADVRTTSGFFTMGFPFGPGTYYVQVVTDFAIGNAWSTRFLVSSGTPVCGDGAPEGTEACDDGNTTPCDGCSPTCTLALDGCDVGGGTCVAEGAASPGNACLVCRRTVTRSGYSPAPAGATCSDGMFCTVDSCDGAGTCAATPRACDDGRACTTDACDEAAGACTNDVTAGCLVGGACVAEGAADPAASCSICLGAVRRDGYSAAPAGTACDDGAFCTAGDACDASGACAGSATSPCDDGDECTDDACDEDLDACQHAPVCGDDASPAPDAGPGDAGTGDAPLDASSPGTDGGRDASAGIDGGASPPPAAAGCACRAAEAEPRSTLVTVVGGLGAIVLVGGRRRRRLSGVDARSAGAGISAR